MAQHGEDDPALGQPICGECYDYASHLVWQWWAPDLWRRFTIALHRLVAKQLQVPANRLAEVAKVQYAKVAEYQVRGAGGCARGGERRMTTRKSRPHCGVPAGETGFAIWWS